MATASKVTFAATEPEAQAIPWVQVRTPDGRETTYVSSISTLSREQLAQLPRRLMDCTDCHNRSAHGFPLPDPALDQALFNGDVSPALPSIKRLLVKALTTDYRTRDEAHRTIRDTVTEAYRATYPEVLRQRRTEIERAIQFASSLYDRAVFPDLGVDWRSYPNQLGHRFSPGCFRCHDGHHVSAAGKVLTNDCGTSCHTLPTMGPPTANGVFAPNAANSWHPWQLPVEDLNIAGHNRLLCADCHGAGRVPKSACDDCHRPPGI